MFRGVPVQPIVMIFGTVRDLTDVINRVKVVSIGFKGFGLRKGQSLGLPIGNRNGAYHALCVALMYTHTMIYFTCKDRAPYCQ